MSYRPFPKDRTATGAQARFQDGAEASIRGTFDSLGGTPAQGKLLKDIDVSATAKSFQHNLGRRYTGYILVGDKTGISYLKNTPGNQDGQSITLTANVTATVSVWVF